MQITRNENELVFDVDVNEDWFVAGDGLWSETSKLVHVTHLFMTMPLEDDEHVCSDLRVGFDTNTWNVDSEGLIYTDSAFLKKLQEYLLALGFDAEAVGKVTYSEAGMQDEEYVSCDAFELADCIVQKYNSANT